MNRTVYTEKRAVTPKVRRRVVDPTRQFHKRSVFPISLGNTKNNSVSSAVRRSSMDRICGASLVHGPYLRRAATKALSYHYHPIPANKLP